MAFYADKDYTEDQAVLDAMNAVMQGNLALHWFGANTEKVKCRPADPRRGLTYEDTNIGSYGYDRHPGACPRTSNRWWRAAARSLATTPTWAM